MPRRHSGMTYDLPPEPPEDAPARLAALWPLVRQWASSDDVARDRRLESATDAELQDLSSTVRPVLADINAYLDASGDGWWSVPFGDLAQAAIEAEYTLAKRRR
jgi:hypothetical protein